jgi:cyclophilin family peptidyl-prolyl cis-trans isomerase
MLDRVWGRAGDGSRSPRALGARRPSGRERRPSLEDLESRRLLAATLAPIPTATVPAYLGFQVPLEGTGGGATQTFTATSTNPSIKATVATGQYMTLNITHTAAAGNPSDITFSGPITFQLFNDLTPQTASKIESFVTSGFYNGKKFHRVANGFPGPNDFIVQGGSASGNGSGNSGLPGTPFPDEFNQQLAFTGTFQLAMANSGPDTNDTQFFITTGSPQFLNFHHTIFGQVVAGQNIVNEMTQVAKGADGTTPLSPILINNSSLSTTNPNGVLHIDATRANPGETATVTVTATDPATHTTATQTFAVNVVPQGQVERPFVQQLPNQSVGPGQVLVFQIPAVAPTPGDQLTYTIQGGFNAATGQFTPIQNATATVDQKTGIVRVTPNAGFSGVITLLYGVRDQVNRSGAAQVEDPSNYQWHTFTLNVNASGAAVTLPPIAVQFSQSVPANIPTNLQLTGDNTNPGTNPTLTFAIASQPLFGTITNFNPQTGALTYTPPTNYTGPDRFQYTVTASGAGQPTLTSQPAYVNLTVLPASTGAVRMIGNVLVVTPLPRTDHGTNTIVVSQTSDAAGGLIQVVINGTLDTANQPPASTVDRIVVFGSKANDNITIDPSVTVPAVTLDGGHGGRNIVHAGGTSTREHGWFGFNTLNGGTGPNQLVGRKGHVKFKPTATTDEIFAGFERGKSANGRHRAPGGTFFRFANGRLVPIPLNRLSVTPVTDGQTTTAASFTQAAHATPHKPNHKTGNSA